MKRSTKMLAIPLALSAGFGAKVGLEAADGAVTERNARIAATAPAAGEVCVIEATGLAPDQISPIQLADRYADGKAIGPMADSIGIVAQAHPEAGVAICRDPNGDEGLKGNHVVDPTQVPESQIVDTETFASDGGVSDDVG